MCITIYQDLLYLEYYQLIKGGERQESSVAQYWWERHNHSPAE